MSLISVRNLSMHFGGVKAVHEVSFNINAGEIYSVIGPNGAGKTTLFNMITGIYVPTSGDILFADQSIVGTPPHRLAGLGLARTFQNLQICMNMSALENVMVGAHLQLNRNMVLAALRWLPMQKQDRALRERCLELMQFVALDFNSHKAQTIMASALSYGQLKRLEIARALAMQPKILFLDEPAAGLNTSETQTMIPLIQKLAHSGITVVLVEHDMKMVMKVSDRVLVLDYGKKLAEGNVEEIRHNEAVIVAYLGHPAQ